jgi:SPP1 family predicted phage head-tail adaptor
MTYDHELSLVSFTSGTNANADPILVPTKIDILCGLNSVGRGEFYAAAALQLRPELVFTIHAYEYDNQQVVEFQGIRYKVIRTYATSFEELELTCQKEVGSGG